MFVLDGGARAIQRAPRERANRAIRAWRAIARVADSAHEDARSRDVPRTLVRTRSISHS
jgi:hypothetical protein